MDTSERETSNFSVAEKTRKKNADVNAKSKTSRSFLSAILQAAALTLVAFVLYLVITPSPIEPQTYITNFTIPRFDGVLTSNTKLQNTKRLFQGKVYGPDSITKDRNGNLYSGLADGRIVKINPSGAITLVARTGQNLPICGTYDTEPKCGRPLGLRLDKSEQHLIVCDAYYGLLQINLENNEVKTLISPDEGVDGLAFGFLNDVVISSHDMLYFTDSSWKWKRRNSRYAVLEATGRGRLMSYNMVTKESKTLLRDLFIPNGLELSFDEEFVLVAETTTSRILRFYIQGPKKGSHDIFAENLPGYPANIRPSKDGGYWLGLIAIRKWPFAFLDFVGPYPFLRRILTKLMSQDSMTRLIPKYGMLLKIGANGEILTSFHDPTAAVIGEVTEVYEDHENGVLYLGSHNHDFIGKLKL